LKPIPPTPSFISENLDRYRRMNKNDCSTIQTKTDINYHKMKKWEEIINKKKEKKLNSMTNRGGGQTST